MVRLLIIVVVKHVYMYHDYTSILQLSLLVCLLIMFIHIPPHCIFYINPQSSGIFFHPPPQSIEISMLFLQIKHCVQLRIVQWYVHLSLKNYSVLVCTSSDKLQQY